YNKADLLILISLPLIIIILAVGVLPSSSRRFLLDPLPADDIRATATPTPTSTHLKSFPRTNASLPGVRYRTPPPQAKSNPPTGYINRSLSPPGRHG
ncbi:hypothetical protein LINPERHAP1_LOCUS9732, partial [Linum perenne]